MGPLLDCARMAADEAGQIIGGYFSTVALQFHDFFFFKCERIVY